MTTVETQEAWAPPRFTPELPEGELQTWTDLTKRAAETARRFGWTKSEVARRSGVAIGTLSQWYDGNYNGRISNVSVKVERWLDSVEDFTAAASQVPVPPSFIQTPTAKELMDTLLYAQMMPEMVVVTLGAGMGKTMTAMHYQNSRPNAFVVTMRPTTATVHGMMVDLANVLDIQERNAVKLDRAIGQKLANIRNTLIIIDEAQHLCDNAVNQLRYFLDINGVGIALLGNEELYGRFGGNRAVPAYAQIHRRIGKRLRRLQPLPGDIDAMVNAWSLKDEQTRKLARAIGRKPGALSQINKTLQLAGIYAAGEGREVSPADIKAAWANRGGEGL